MGVIGITGAAGTIGARFCEALTKRGDTPVVGIDLSIPTPAVPGLSFRRMDVRDPRLSELWRETGVKRVVHLAAVFDPIHDPSKMREVNVEGTRNVLAAAERCGAEQILLVGSTAAYGAHPDNPARLTEDRPLRPNRGCRYAIDQLEVERLVADFTAARRGIEVAVLRACAVLGPTVRNFITRTFQQPLVLLPTGTDPELQFIHEDDLLAACLAVLEERHSGTWNLVGTGTLELSDCLARIGNRVLRLPPPILERLTGVLWGLRFPLTEAPSSFLPFLRFPCLADGEKARREIGFSPRYTTAEAFESFLKTFL
jgi:UDP-glucose 4-epimerase